MAREDRTGRAYNEHAFRHFLAIERKRAARARRPFLLVLVGRRRAAMGRGTASRLFSALARCIREVDFLGWYRSDRVAAAVLTQGSPIPAPDAPQRICERVADALRTHLPAHELQQLQVRVVQLCRRSNE